MKSGLLCIILDLCIIFVRLMYHFCTHYWSLVTLLWKEFPTSIVQWLVSLAKCFCAWLSDQQAYSACWPQCELLLLLLHYTEQISSSTLSRLFLIAGTSAHEKVFLQFCTNSTIFQAFILNFSKFSVASPLFCLHKRFWPFLEYKVNFLQLHMP